MSCFKNTRQVLLIAFAVGLLLSNCQKQKHNDQKFENMETKQVANPMTSGLHNPGRVYFVTFIYYAAGGEATFREFMSKAAPIWEEHKLGNLGVIKVGMKRAIEGENNIEQPDEIRLNYAEDMALFEEFTQNAELQKINHLREASFRRLNFVLASEEDISGFKTYFDTPLDSRMYAVQLLHFKEGGEAGYRDFTKQALPVFEKYGLHFDYWLEPIKKVDAKGDGSDMDLPDKVVIFHADDPSVLQAYNEDPEYLRLAPIRAAAVEHNKLFGGKLVSWGL